MKSNTQARTAHGDLREFAIVFALVLATSVAVDHFILSRLEPPLGTSDRWTLLLLLLSGVGVAYDVLGWWILRPGQDREVEVVLPRVVGLVGLTGSTLVLAPGDTQSRLVILAVFAAITLVPVGIAIWLRERRMAKEYVTEAPRETPPAQGAIQAPSSGGGPTVAFLVGALVVAVMWIWQMHTRGRRN